MNLLLVPMWLLSGALFPMSGASSWVRVIMLINPMTYAMGALRQVLYLGATNPIGDICSLTTAVCAVLFGLGMIAVSVLLVSRRALQPELSFISSPLSA